MDVKWDLPACGTKDMFMIEIMYIVVIMRARRGSVNGICLHVAPRICL